MKLKCHLFLVSCLLSQLSLVAGRSSPRVGPDSKGTIKLEVVPFPPYHAAGNDVPTLLRLKRANGRPVTLEDLQVSDAANVDLLVVDESLSDFHYQHLTATDTPGEYRFVLRSKYGGRYFVWVGVSSSFTGEKQFEKATVQVEGGARSLDKVAKWSGTTDEYHYHLTIAGGDALIAGQPARLNLKVTKPTGEPIELEPTMRRLASLTAFAGDFTAATRIVSTNDPISGESAQGPQLTFIFTPPSPGFWKLFSEVKLGGFPRIASFGVNVSEAFHCKECAEVCRRCAEACHKKAT